MNLENLDLHLLSRTMERDLNSIAIRQRMAFAALSAAAPRSPRAWLADRLLAAAIRLDRGAGRRLVERMHIQHA